MTTSLLAIHGGRPEIAERFSLEGLLTSLYVEDRRQEQSISSSIVERFGRAKAAVVFIGSGDLPWANEPQRKLLALLEAKQCPIITVLLPNSNGLHEDVPYSRNSTPIDLSVDADRAMNQLIKRITGKSSLGFLESYGEVLDVPSSISNADEVISRYTELSQATASALRRDDWSSARQLLVELAEIARRDEKLSEAEDAVIKALDIADTHLDGRGIKEPLTLLSELHSERLQEWLKYCKHRQEAAIELRQLIITGRPELGSVLRNSGVSLWSQWFKTSPPDFGAIERLPRASQGFPFLRLRRLRLSNIKCFHDFELSLLATEYSPRMCTALVGDNATGKSTILQAIALGCLGPSLANQTGMLARYFLRKGADRGEIELEFDIAIDPQPTPDEIEIIHTGMVIDRKENDFRALPDSEMRLGKHNVAQWLSELRRQVGIQWGFCCGYGAFRGLRARQDSSPTEKGVKVELDRVLSLFQSYNTLVDLSVVNKILRNADVSALTSDRSSISLDIRDAILDQLQKIIPGTEVRDQFGERRLIEKYDGVGTFAAMSDGCNSMLGLLTHLIRHGLEACGWVQNPFHIHGIALINELDLHLHPIWQRRILSQLQDAFPSIQFIVTTHSPLVLGGVPDGQVGVLKRVKSGRIELIMDTPSIKGWRADQLLTGFHFGVGSSYDEETEFLMEEYAKALQEHGPDNAIVKHIEDQLDRLPLNMHGSSPLDRKAWDLLSAFVDSQVEELDDHQKMLLAAKLWSMLGS